MLGMKTVGAVLALTVLTAGCSGGSSDPAEPVSEAASAAHSGPPATAGTAVTYASLTGDAASGKAAFMQCRTCHVVDPGMNRIGPSLANIVGREAGTVAGFNYSKANAESGITWTEEKLFQFLEKPQQVIPQTKMIFAGMPDAQKRADVIAYLKNPG
ncbi:cytochrome c family protein [Sphingopyxis sp. BSNA05]|uniref:c-type cytochrome n=1 Tax=Sphingopyxis sp. BSNA05 TaxID=1236614 RepID=UPI00156566DA|nr:cytochrome c family protein [Sphingopyxis sp. BSNA05]NRD91182.1 cytochrome c family protein [Sphingopyxis sp. BSNA05]